MSSDFEKALARAAMERSAADAVKQQQERERIEKSALARSIVDAYLANLGPKVVATLQKLGIAPLKPRNVWVFEYRRHHESSSLEFSLNSYGRFEIGQLHREGSKVVWRRQGDFGAAYRQGDSFYQESDYYRAREEHLVVDHMTRKVYLILSSSDNHLQNELPGPYSSGRYGELSEFIADYIYTVMVK